MNRARLERTYRGLGFRERVLVEWEFWRTGKQPPPAIRRSMPDAQALGFNRDLDRLIAMDRAASAMALAVERALDTAEAWAAGLAALWIVAARLRPLWELIDPPEPTEAGSNADGSQARVLEALAAGVVALLDPDLMPPGTADPLPNSAHVSLPAMLEAFERRLAQALGEAWQDIRVVELEAEELAADLGCEDALAAVVRDAVTDARARLERLRCGPWAAPVCNLQEPDADVRLLAAPIFRPRSGEGS